MKKSTRKSDKAPQRSRFASPSKGVGSPPIGSETDTPNSDNKAAAQSGDTSAPGSKTSSSRRKDRKFPPEPKESLQSIYRRINTQAAEGMAIVIVRVLREYIEEGRITPEEAAMRFLRACDGMIGRTEASKYVGDIIKVLLCSSFVHQKVFAEFENYTIVQPEFPFYR